MLEKKRGYVQGERPFNVLVFFWVFFGGGRWGLVGEVIFFFLQLKFFVSIVPFCAAIGVA